MYVRECQVGKRIGRKTLFNKLTRPAQVLVRNLQLNYYNSEVDYILAGCVLVATTGWLESAV